MPSTDGSVVIGVDMNVDDAEKQLASLKKKIQDIQSEIEFRKFRKDAILERTKQLGAELDKAKAKLNEMETATKGAFSKEAIKEQSDIVKGIQKEFDRVSGDVEKCDQAISDANISLDYMKQKYEEIAREAERLREAQSGAAGGAGADQPSGMDRARARMSEISKSFRQTLADAAKSGVAAFGAALKRVPSLIKSAFSKGAQFIRSFGKSAISAAKNLNVFARLAESIGPKLSRLGKMIRRVFVFSVITMGLRALRSQLSSYLSVNTELQNALARLKAAFLTAFQPIYEYVVPALTSLINVLTQAMAVVAQFVAALFGTTAKQAQENAKALNQQAKATEAAGGAAEDAGKALASFDKIEKLSASPKGGGGGGAAAENDPVFDLNLDDKAFKSWGEAFDAFLDNILNGGIPKLKKGLNNFSKWLNKHSKKLLKMFTFPGVLDKVKKIGEEIGDAINGLVDDIEWYRLGESFGAGLNLAISFLTSAIKKIGWTDVGASLAEWVNGAVSRINWRDVGYLLWSGFKIGIEAFAGFFNRLNMPELAAAASNLIEGFLDAISETIDRVEWDTLGDQIITFFRGLNWEGIADSANNLIDKLFDAALELITHARIGEIAAKIVNFFIDIDWGRIGDGASNLVAAFINGVSDFFGKVQWDELGRQVTNFVKGINWGNLANAASNLVNKFLDGFIEFVGNIDGEDVGKAIVDFLTGLDWVDFLIKLFDAIDVALNLTLDVLWGIIKNGWDAIITWWERHIEDNSALRIIQSLANSLAKTFDWLLPQQYKNTLELANAQIDAYYDALEISGSSSSVMEGIGGNMVNGLMNGMSSAEGRVNSWSNSILSNIKNNFGVHSPSTELKKIGEYMMDGLEIGTGGEANSVVSVFEKMLASIEKLCAETVDTMTELFVTFLSYLATEFSRQWNTAWQQLYNTAYQNIQKTISAINSLKSALASIERNITIRITTIKTEVSSGLSSGSSSPASAYTLPAVTSIPIPALAQGTVIPPNREFMAVLGDNKTETEVVSPLSTMKQAVMEALRDSGFTDGITIELTALLDGEVIYKNQQKVSRRHGTSFAVGKA